MPRTILLSCGEASGDLYSSHLARAIRARHPDWRLVGIVGPHGRAAGVEAWADMAELTVMGFGEVLRHLPRLNALGRRLVARAKTENVDLFLPVDYPGFHVRVAKKMRGAGIPVLDFIPPKTWSWGRWRLRALRQSVDRCAVIFPFEEAHYRGAGVDTRFVGHPLPRIHGDRLRTENAGEESRAGLLLVPGSRAQEIRRLSPVLAGAVRLWRQNGGQGVVRISRAPNVSYELLEALRVGIDGAQITDAPLLDELLRARTAVVCSGTATVEAALSRCPHLIVYRTGALTYLVAGRLATVEHIGMANIVLQRRAFPEFVQSQCTPARLAAAIERVDRSPQERDAQRAASAELGRQLEGPGCFDSVVDMAEELLAAAVEPRRGGRVPDHRGE